MYALIIWGEVDWIKEVVTQFESEEAAINYFHLDYKRENGDLYSVVPLKFRGE